MKNNVAGNRFYVFKANGINLNHTILISDRRIAILVEDGVNQRQLTVIREGLEKGGVKTELISFGKREVKGWENSDWGIRFKVDSLLNSVTPETFDGVVVPGGPFHADHLRENEQSHIFIRQLFASGRIVAALDHGVQVLIDSEIIKGRKVTGCPSTHTDLKNAGALLQDQDVTADNGLLTGRTEKNVSAFTTALIDSLRKGLRQRTEAVI